MSSSCRLIAYTNQEAYYMMDELLKVEEKLFLERELDRLKQLSDMGKNLRIVWLPSKNSKKEGQVVGRTIYIYSTNIHEALQTLRHEFIDYLICKAIEPYQKLANILLSLISEQAYRKKEKVVEALLRVLDEPPSPN